MSSAMESIVEGYARLNDRPIEAGLQALSGPVGG
jgi:hypothetical protein